MNLYDTLDDSVLKKPGDYILSDIRLISYRNIEGTNTPDMIEIETLVLDLNIFESIHNKTLSGNMLIVDGNNIIGKLPLTGNERLEFKFYTPSLSKGYDFTMKTGNPLYVYKIQNRQAVGPKSQMYLLHFCSKEMIQNELVVVKNAMTDTFSNMAARIIKEQNTLSSAKDLYFEPSKGIHKQVFGRVRPFDAIDEISLMTQSEKYEGAGYYFYETSLGFNYRSLESMLAVDGNTSRPVVARFRPKPSNIRDGGGNLDIKNEMQIAINFRILDQFDTLKNLRNGVFASQLITHDQLNKTYKETNFDYNKEFQILHHTESGKDGVRTDDKGILPLVLRDGAFLSDFAESTLYLKTDTSLVHDNISSIPVKNILQRRLSQRLAFTSFRLEITVNGCTGVTAGDLITFEMPTFAPAGDVEDLNRDPYMSGRYLVTSVRHQLNRQLNKHIMVLECMKDSVRRPYPEQTIDTFIGKEKNNEGIIDIYELDRRHSNQIAGLFK